MSSSAHTTKHTSKLSGVSRPSRKAGGIITAEAGGDVMAHDGALHGALHAGEQAASAEQLGLYQMVSERMQQRTAGHSYAAQLFEETQLAASVSTGAEGRITKRRHYDWVLYELECARQFNFRLSRDLPQAIEQLEYTVESLTGTEKSLILLLDETSGIYTCLNDDKTPGVKAREITRVSDHFLAEMLGCEQVIHGELFAQDQYLGIVAIGNRSDGELFDVKDEYALDVLSRYLSTKVLAYQSFRQAIMLPYIQNTVLDVASHLVSAPDQDSVMAGVLNALIEKFEFHTCQYVALDQTSGNGFVMYEAVQHQGVEKLEAGLYRPVKNFAGMVSLFSSSAWHNAHLMLQQPNLGDTPLSEIFGLRETPATTVVMPVLDTATGQIFGAITMFYTQPGQWVPKETLSILKEVMLMVSLALGRTRLMEKVLEMASRDELTGLTNRRGFYERFEQEIDRARRSPSPLAVAMIDVDHFKSLNDTYGHLCGDQVLQILAEVFSHNVRKTDLVCRFGGEEFAILLPNTSAHAAAELLDRIRHKVEKLTIQSPAGQKVKITISAGVAPVEVRPDDAPSQVRERIAEALSRADIKLYNAKESGRNQVLLEG